MRNIDPLGNRLALQPIAANNYKIVRQTASQYVIPKQSNIRSPKLEGIKREEDNYARAVQTMQQKTYKTKIYSKDDEEEKNEIIRNKESRQSKKSYKTIPLSNRLEIMNKSEKFKPSSNDESGSIKRENRSINHGDVNLFSYYSDRSDHDYAAFSIPRISRAI
jgi:hypothetical protein